MAPIPAVLAATPQGSDPTGTVAASVLVALSMTDTVFEF